MVVVTMPVVAMAVVIVSMVVMAVTVVIMSMIVVAVLPVIVPFVSVGLVVVLPVVVPVAMLSCHNGILTPITKAAPHLGRGAAAFYHWPFVEPR